MFYFHIGTAWTALLGFILAAIFSVIYLITKDLKWDRLQVAAIEVSLVFFLITIVLGSIWARPAWNTWWTWDPRLDHCRDHRVDLYRIFYAPPGN